MLRKSLGLLVLSLSMYCSFAYAAPVFIVDASKNLLGADNVMVDGLAYDVRFVDGSCETLFAGCSTSAFTFHDAATAHSASQALMDTVFVDSAPVDYDALLIFINGCNGSILICMAMTPYDIGNTRASGPIVYLSDAMNGEIEQFDKVTDSTLETGCHTDGIFPSGCDLAFLSANAQVYAVWTLHEEPSNVPEPGTPLLLGAAAIALAARRKTGLAMGDERKRVHRS